MSASAWHHQAPAARILCAGDELGELIHLQCDLDGEFDFVIVATEEEAHAALASEGAFDIIIIDLHVERLGGRTFVEQLGRHSPDAERLLVIDEVDATVAEMLESDSRVMRVLHSPIAADVLCDAVADALLRHRARALRASAVPRVTPMGGNPCCTAMPTPPHSHPVQREPSGHVRA